MDNCVGRREKERYNISVMGNVRTNLEASIQAEITDLSENGCACTVGTQSLKRNDHASLRIGDLDPINATIRWVNDRQVGIEFYRPVYGPVFDHLREMIAQANKRRDRRHLFDDISALADAEARRRATQTRTNEKHDQGFQTGGSISLNCAQDTINIIR